MLVSGRCVREPRNSLIDISLKLYFKDWAFSTPLLKSLWKSDAASPEPPFAEDLPTSTANPSITVLSVYETQSAVMLTV